ncbi:MAG: hypothetical protein D6753_10095 [Planctomycetota bacterium]|nr:MAG: hypothetical protein D6753_10095 [Planctomycetota bacterium]
MGGRTCKRRLELGHRLKVIALGCLLITGIAPATWAQLSYEQPPINYGSATPDDAVQDLIHRIQQGHTSLEYSPRHGWLPDLLEAMHISPESQVLVFSKTSLQLHKISPRTPRAIYFNDDVYVGWCQNGDVVEIAATDPRLGSVFYTVDQTDTREIKISRDRGGCLTCHASHRTQDIPGLLVRSIYSDFNGRPRTGTRTYVTDHTTPFEQRYGGWYVTGEHGTIRHMGNLISTNREHPEEIDRDAGANRLDLTEFFDVSPYLRPHSDMVALMVLEHQTQMHNLLARLAIETRLAQHYDEGMNEILGRPPGSISDSTKRRIATAGEKLVRYMLFADETPLNSEIRGPSRYRELFETGAIGPVYEDSRGRHLRQFDLERRMFKYPCSFLIYSKAFRELPPLALEWVCNRLKEVLSAESPPDGYESLSDEDRRAVLEILEDTLPTLFRSPATAT